MRKPLKLVAATLAFLIGATSPTYASAADPIPVSTFAGTGTAGTGGDHADATQSALNTPYSVAVDTAGNVYIADSINHRIQKVDTTGAVTTIAGTGTLGAGGDNADATQSALKYPRGVTVDADGNIYIADTYNNRVQKVDTTGAVTTIAGTGTPGTGGDHADATQSALKSPYGMTVDAAGNVYIADANNHRIQKVDTTGAVTTFAGTGTSGAGGNHADATQSALNAPVDVALDAAGNVYIADTYNHRIRKVDTTGAVTTIAGTGITGMGDNNTDATQSALNTPYGVSVDAIGNMYIADSLNHRIRRVDTTGAVTTIAGTGTGGTGDNNTDATQSALNFPVDVAVDTAGNIYIADIDNQRIQRVGDFSTGTESAVCQRKITGTNVSATGNPGAVARIYMATFKRQPDSDGQAFWVSQREAGVTLNDIANFFVNSDEFTATYNNLNDTEFIDLLYENVMCRTGETEGATFWTDLLDDGRTRADIVLWFSQSPEFKTLTVTS